MSKLSSCPAQVVMLIDNLASPGNSVWARDNFYSTLVAVRDESDRAIKSFEKERLKATSQSARKKRASR